MPPGKPGGIISNYLTKLNGQIYEFNSSFPFMHKYYAQTVTREYKKMKYFLHYKQIKKQTANGQTIIEVFFQERNGIDHVFFYCVDGDFQFSGNLFMG